MTDNDEQGPDTEKPKSRDHEPELPDVDDEGLASAGSSDSDWGDEIQLGSEETALDEIDSDIIDISDEEVLREFQQMDAEEKGASEPSTASSDTNTIARKSAAADKVESAVPADARKSIPDHKELPPANSADGVTGLAWVAHYVGKLPPKVIYGSIPTLAILVAIIVFVSIGTQPAPTAEQAAVADEEILLEQPDRVNLETVEQTSSTQAESIFVAALPVQPIAAAPTNEIAANVTEELPAAAELEPANGENTGGADGQPVVVEATGPVLEATTTLAEEPPIVAASSVDGDEIITLRETTGRWYIIVASFLTELKAREHADKLSANEDTPTIISPFAGSSRYRVAVASYESMTEVQAALASYKSQYGDDSWPLRYVVAGTTTMLSEVTDKFYVVVSSFSIEALARKHADMLAATGENPVIIPPFGQSRQYRVALFDYASVTAAQADLARHREKYGSDVWLLRY